MQADLIERGYPGIAIAVSVGGETAWSEGFGWAIEHDDAGRSLLSHGGGSVGGTSLMIMQPDTGVIVVGLISLTRANNGVVREVLRRFIDAAASTVH